MMYPGTRLQRKVTAHRERQGHGRVQVRAGDRTHEQDDREHHQPRSDHRGREADLPLGMQDPAASGNEHQHECPEQLGEQPAVLELGIVELSPRPELEHQQAPSPREVVI